MKSYNYTTVGFKPINDYLKTLLKIYKMDGSIFFPDNSDEWSVSYKIKVYKTKELYNKKYQDKDALALYARLNIDKEQAKVWMVEGKCYIYLGELVFHPENNIHDIYHEANHLTFHILELLNDLGYHLSNGIAREEFFNNLTFAIVNTVEEKFKKLKIEIK